MNILHLMNILELEDGSFTSPSPPEAVEPTEHVQLFTDIFNGEVKEVKGGFTPRPKYPFAQRMANYYAMMNERNTVPLSREIAILFTFWTIFWLVVFPIGCNYGIPYIIKLLGFSIVNGIGL